MTTEFLKYNELENDNILKKAAAIINNGGLVAFPTETVYGLGANAYLEESAKKIFEVKGRPSDNPLIVHIAKKEDVKVVAKNIPDSFYKLSDAFWPGPLTMIMEKSEHIPYSVTAGLETVGIRMPDNDYTRYLIEKAGCPVAAPSANISGTVSATKAEYVYDDFKGKIPYIIDGGNSKIGLESTVITLCTETPKLLRPGGFTYEKLCALLGKVEISDAVLEQLKEGQKPESPGMKYKHYAPETKVVLVKGTHENIKAYLAEKYKSENCGIICFDEDFESKSERILRMGSRQNMTCRRQSRLEEACKNWEVARV